MPFMVIILLLKPRYRHSKRSHNVKIKIMINQLKLWLLYVCSDRTNYVYISDIVIGTGLVACTRSRSQTVVRGRLETSCCRRDSLRFRRLWRRQCPLGRRGGPPVCHTLLMFLGKTHLTFILPRWIQRIALWLRWVCRAVHIGLHPTPARQS